MKKSIKYVALIVLTFLIWGANVKADSCFKSGAIGCNQYAQTIDATTNSIFKPVMLTSIGSVNGNAIGALNNNAPQIEDIVFCEKSGILKAFQIIGYVLFIAKILVPLLLIILGTIDFSKAVISGDDKANSDAVKLLIRRVIIAVVIFLIPTILNYVLVIVDGATATASEFSNCTTCLLDPGNCSGASLEVGSNQ